MRPAASAAGRDRLSTPAVFSAPLQSVHELPGRGFFIGRAGEEEKSLRVFDGQRGCQGVEQSDRSDLVDDFAAGRAGARRISLRISRGSSSAITWATKPPSENPRRSTWW